MIKPNELRIGNLIFENGEESRIYQLSSGGISFFTINDINVNRETGATLNDGAQRFTPIPLTPEWLGRLGFVKDEQHECFDIWEADCEVGVSYFDDAVNVVGHSMADSLEHIKFVHQLQNLYAALKGEELTIK